MYDLVVYDDAFYDMYGSEAKRMAPWLMPLLREVIPFRSLVDVGCGEGWYLAWLKANGHPNDSLYGLEGSAAAVARAVYPIIHHDLRKPLHDNWGRFDVALSFEVAEHIEPEYADIFVDTLCALSDVIVMTAAFPGQGGLQHVNEQPLSYWEDLFDSHEFVRDDGLLLRLNDGIRQSVDAGQYCAPWLLPNLMVLRRV